MAVADVMPLRHAILRAGLPAETARFEGDDDPGAVHLAAFEDKRIVGVVTLLPRAMPDGDPGMPAYQLRGMAVVASHRNRGIGAILLRACAARARDGGAAMIWCNARIPAVNFYRRHGFSVHGEAFDIPSAGPHHRMSLMLPDV